MTGVIDSLRRHATPIVARGSVLGASLAASTLLIRVQGLALFGLLATLLLLARVGSALVLGESQLVLARRDTSARAILHLDRSGVVRILIAVAITGAGAAVSADRFGASSSEVASFVALSVVLALVAALLRVVSIVVAQAGHTSLSAVSDVSLVAPAAALTFTISNMHVASLLQIALLVGLGTFCARYLMRGTAPAPPLRTTPWGDVVGFAVFVLPMLHGQVGPVLGMFGLSADDVGLLAFAQRLASGAPLILAGGGASVLAASLSRARAVTVQFAKWGGLVFAVASLVILAVWPLIRSVLGVEDIGVTVVALVFAANLVNVAFGPVGQYCAVAGLQRLDGISLVAAIVALVPFAVIDQSATTAAIGAVTVAVVRNVLVWILLLRAERAEWKAPRASPSAVGGVTVD